MRANTIIQSFAAVVFGFGFVVFGIVAFVNESKVQQRVEAKLQSIGDGTVQAEALVVVRKYVNPGRRGGAHIVFKAEKMPKVDLWTTKDFFNSVNLGDSVKGYSFADGYFIPENRKPNSAGGKWFMLGLGVLMGGGVMAAGVASARSDKRGF